MAVLGVDIGGTGIKCAPVDVETGELLAERLRVLTPQPSTPEAVADVVADLVGRFPDVDGPIGCTFPGIVKEGVTITAANVDKGWTGLDADALLTKRLQREVHVLNDADAAGIAEMRFGAGRDEQGTVLLVTIGTGLGTALFRAGVLVPNTELGHITVQGVDAEELASERTREREGLTWKQYAARLDNVLAHLELFVSPDLIILGGGGSKKADKYLPLLRRTCRVVPAEMRNAAGVVGAAMAVHAP
jgi:polyphosphate glucokinase